jgi:sensor histidine kinase regulating citrate/malate metabolism
LYFFTCLIIANFVNKEKSDFKFPIGLYFYPLSVVASLIVFWNICSKSNIRNEHQIALAIISAILFASIIILFISYQRSIEKENDLFLLQNELDKIKTDKTYYDILEEQNENLMLYAHDTKNHLSAIQELNTNPEIDKYIVEMTNRLKAHSESCHSGNHTLDVIINKYETECKLKNVDFSFDVKLSNLKVLNDYDLVAILGNILDNALESASTSNEKYISIKTNKINTYDSLIVTNSCDTAPSTINNELKTTKKDKKMHGIGMKSVLKTLKKYDGDLEWEYDEINKQFITTIILLNAE